MSILKKISFLNKFNFSKIIRVTNEIDSKTTIIFITTVEITIAQGSKANIKKDNLYKKLSFFKSAYIRY